MENKTRLDILADYLTITKDHFQSRNSLLTKQPIKENESEFFLETFTNIIFYYVFATDEEKDATLQSLLFDLYTEEELIELYGVNEKGEVNLSTADINTYLNYENDHLNHSIYSI